MTNDQIIRMARELVTKHGSRMCDEDGETHGEELYCVCVEDIAEIIKQSAAHERKRIRTALKKAFRRWRNYIIMSERDACAKHVSNMRNNDEYGEFLAAAIRSRNNND